MDKGCTKKIIHGGERIVCNENNLEGNLAKFKAQISDTEKISDDGGKSRIVKNMSKGCTQTIVEQGEPMVCNENNLSDGADVIKNNVEVHAKKETKKRIIDNRGTLFRLLAIIYS